MNKLSKYALLFAAFAGMVACSDSKVATGDYEIIPLPQDVSLTNGTPFILTPSTSISYPEGNDLLKQAGEFLASYIKEATGYAPKVVTDKSAKPINLSIDKSITNPEGYRLTVTTEGIELAGATEAGVFYGVQSLRKSIPAVAEGMNIELPTVTINDYPRFAYRGMHLDVSRHFFPADSIKKYIDILALHNMNTFHWHLSDDQGWRIEIKKYPELTTIGSQRKETVIGRNSGEYDGKPYGGFYTQDEIRDVIAYAKERFITIIPEIDLPGHQQAALAAYPDLGCTGGPYEVWTQWGISDDVICAGNDKAMGFLEDVLSEVIDLFPSEYIHIGGDECPKVRWKTCPKCQALIERERLDGIQGLQPYMIARIQDFLASKGRVMVGWDEILHNELHSETLVMSYRGQKGAIEAANRGNYAVMTPGEVLYFDWYQADPSTQPRAMYGYSPIKKMYAFEPVPADPESAARNESIIRAEFVDPAAVEPIRADRADRIVGVQGCTWAEYIEDEEQQEYMIFPRLLAVAELAWTPQEKREWSDFKVRMNSHIPLLQQRGLNTFTLSDEVEITTRIRSGNRAVEVTLDCEKYPAEIRYTLDGTPPTPDASLYEAPFTVTDSTVVRAAVCRDGVIRSPERKQLVTLAAEIDNYYPFDVPEIWKEYFD